MSLSAWLSRFFDTNLIIFRGSFSEVGMRWNSCLLLRFSRQLAQLCVQPKKRGPAVWEHPNLCVSARFAAWEPLSLLYKPL